MIRNGALTTFLVDFFCSRKLGRRQNAGCWNLVIPPGERSVNDLIRETERGIVLARFSGGVPNHKLDFSGVAKNSFYVEDGEIRYPLIETMASGNFQDLLMNVRGGVERVRRLRRRRIPLAGRLGDHDFATLNAGERTPGGWPISATPPAASDSAPKGTEPAVPSGARLRITASAYRSAVPTCIGGHGTVA